MTTLIGTRSRVTDAGTTCRSSCRGAPSRRPPRVDSASCRSGRRSPERSLPRASWSSRVGLLGGRRLAYRCGVVAADAAGNMTSRSSTGSPTQSLVWDAEGRLGSVTTASPAATVASYLYDASGERLLRREAGKATLYLGSTEISASVSDASAPATGVRYYSHGDRVIATRTGPAKSHVTTLFADPQGTATHSATNTTSVLTTRRSTPYGAPRQWPVWPSDRGFLHGPVDAGTGLTHLGAREYDPSLARFISVDPLLDTSVPLHLNGYGYALNNPTTFSDPDGRIPVAASNSDYISIGALGGGPSKWTPKAPTPKKSSKPKGSAGARFTASAWDNISETVKGLFTLAKECNNISLLVGGCSAANTTAASLVQQGPKATASMYWNTFTSPYTSRWGAGDRAGTAGYIAPDAILMALGGIGALGKLAHIGKLKTLPNAPPKTTTTATNGGGDLVDVWRVVGPDEAAQVAKTRTYQVQPGGEGK